MEILEAAEELVSDAETPGVSLHALELLVRLILAYDRGLV